MYVKLPLPGGSRWHAACTLEKDCGDRLVVRTFDGTLHIADREDVTE